MWEFSYWMPFEPESCPALYSSPTMPSLQGRSMTKTFAAANASYKRRVLFYVKNHVRDVLHRKCSKRKDRHKKPGPCEVKNIMQAFYPWIPHLPRSQCSLAIGKPSFAVLEIRNEIQSSGQLGDQGAEGEMCRRN